jgi:hypothetical protein
MPVDKLVNEAIDATIDAAVFVNLVGELGPHIDKATASALMPVDEAINKVAASAQMLADEAVDAAVFVKLRGRSGPLIDKAAASA